MVKKDTAKLLEELQSYSEFKKFHNMNADLIAKKELSVYLGELLKIKGIKKSEAVKRSELNEVYAYQIFSGVRVPERHKLLSIAIGMRLNLEETQTLLKCSGYAQLYAKNEFDCIVIYSIFKGFSVIETNSLLYEYGFNTLG